MSGSFFKSFYSLIAFIVFLVLFISCFFGPSILFKNQFYSFDPSIEFLWPSPGYTYITSYFGKRSSPTSRS